MPLADKKLYTGVSISTPWRDPPSHNEPRSVIQKGCALEGFHHPHAQFRNHLNIFNQKHKCYLFVANLTKYRVHQTRVK